MVEKAKYSGPWWFKNFGNCPNSFFQPLTAA